MQLDEFTKSKCKWHLGYNQTSIPAGDLARLEEALDNVQDSFWFSKIVEQIGRCDEAEKRTDMTGILNNNITPAGRRENIAGDVDRTISTTDYKDTLKTWTGIYLYETDRLAQHLYVPNYRNPEQARYRFNREGAEFIQALPGPADVAVGTRLMFATELRQYLFIMSKEKKMPPQLLEYFKNKNKKKEDGKEMSDKEKRKEALDKARDAKNKKKDKKDK